MSYKERFKASIDKFKNAKALLRAESDEFNKAGTKSEDEVKENTKKITKTYQAELKKLKSELNDVIGDKRKELVGENDKGSDKDYQLRLTNLETVFLRDGNSMSKEFVIKGMVLFTEDPIALNSIRTALLQSGRTEGEVLELIPPHEKDATIEKVVEIEKSLDKKLKIALPADVDEYLGYETILATLDENFDYVG